MIKRDTYVKRHAMVRVRRHLKMQRMTKHVTDRVMKRVTKHAVQHMHCVLSKLGENKGSMKARKEG